MLPRSGCFHPRDALICPTNRAISPLRPATQAGSGIVNFECCPVFNSPVQASNDERNSETQWIECVGLQDGRALPGLAVAGGDVCGSTPLDRKKFAGEDFLEGLLLRCAH